MLLRLPAVLCSALATTALFISGLRGAEAATCAEAARSAEARSDLPPGLLGAIGRVESGGWSWSVNGNDGSPGRRFATAADAQLYTQQLLDGGHRTVDVGCFQVDLRYHPDAFARWQDAFDGDTNAEAAAGILHRLYNQSGDWHRAIALYHSADEQRGATYLQAVLSAWSGRMENAAPLLPLGDPYVIAMRPALLRLAAWQVGPDRPEAQGMWRGSRRLPRVIVP